MSLRSCEPVAIAWLSRGTRCGLVMLKSIPVSWLPLNWAGTGLIVAVSALLCAVAASARATAIVLSGGMLIESRTGSAGTKHVLSVASSAIGAKEGIDLGLSEALGWSGSL